MAWSRGWIMVGVGKGSAVHLTVEPTGLVKDCEIVSERGQRVNMLGFSGHEVSLGATQHCC